LNGTLQLLIYANYWVYTPFRTTQKFYLILVGNGSRSKHTDNQIYMPYHHKAQQYYKDTQ